MMAQPRSPAKEGKGRDMWVESKVLVGEVNPADSEWIRQLLSRTGRSSHQVGTAEEVLAALRGEIFTQAVIGVELTLGSQPVLSMLSQLPAITKLIGTGPAGDADAERRCRLAGANVYLSRPVDPAALAKALAWRETAGAYVAVGRRTGIR